MAVTIRIRRGNTSQWNARVNPLAVGEFGWDTQAKELKIGNGTLLWSSLVPINLPENNTFANSSDIITSYNDLTDLPTLFDGNYNSLSNTPTLFSGSYTDLTNKPTLFSGSYTDLTDKPTIPSLTGYATETYVNEAISDLVNTAPETLDTLNELAEALNNDENFATTVTTALAGKQDSLPNIFYSFSTDIELSSPIASASWFPLDGKILLGATSEDGFVEQDAELLANEIPMGSFIVIQDLEDPSAGVIIGTVSPLVPIILNESNKIEIIVYDPSEFNSEFLEGTLSLSYNTEGTEGKVLSNTGTSYDWTYINGLPSFENTIENDVLSISGGGPSWRSLPISVDVDALLLGDFSTTRLIVPGLNIDWSSNETLPASKLTTIDSKSGSYTLSPLDLNKMIEMSNGGTLTVVDSFDFPDGFTVNILQTGSSQVTLAGSGFTINATPGLKLRAQWSSATLVKRGFNSWVAMGDLSA
jgi:hypothetical protein